MTTWLPVLCAIIVVFFAALFAIDPAFSRGRDHLIGAIWGLLVGGSISIIVYSLVYLVDWALTAAGG